jgi:hypothetical protein
VGTFNSGQGGTLAVTFAIPAAFNNVAKIAIRLESPQGWFAYNWFPNVTSGSGLGTPAASPAPTTPSATLPAASPTAPAATPAATAAPGTPAPPVPGLDVTAVERGESVTIQTSNFPANQNFTVTMGPIGSQGIGGTVVGTTSSGAGGSFSATYEIPASLAGEFLIAIRLQSPQGWFAYGWFFNQDSP